MKKTQKFRKLPAFIFVAFFVASLLSVIVPPQAMAARSDWQSLNVVANEVYENTSSHQHYYWLLSCFINHDIDKTTQEEVDGWDFFQGGDGNEAVLGGMYEGKSSYYIGARNCDDQGIVKQAFTYLGFTGSSREVFCSIPGKQYGGKDVDKDTCIAGIGGNPDHWDNGKDNDERADWFASNAKQRPFGGPEEYMRAYMTLISSEACKAQPVNSTLYNSVNEVPDKDNDNIYAIPVITKPDGSDQFVIKYVKGIGISNNDNNGNITYVATTKHTDDAADASQRLRCKDILTKAQDNADNYRDWLNDNPDAASPEASGGPTKSGKEENDCWSNSGPLAWLLCGVLEVLDGTIAVLDSAIQNLLFIDSSTYKDPSLTQGWGTIRNIALIILVPMMMFMVIGTALNFGPFDPYTVKKSLPRMFVATIFIVLSLPITQFGVQISNMAGQGLGNLLVGLAPNEYNSLGEILGARGSNDTFGGLFAVGAIAAVPLVIGTIGSLMLVAIGGLLIGFITLVMRQVLIIALMVLAPLAILSWIFPGNDKLWGIWKTTFIAMLMLYPIVSVLIASGKFVAGILG